MSADQINLLQVFLGAVNLLVLIVTIWLLARQLKEMARSTRASVYQTIPTMMLEIDRFFVDHPEIRPYFYDGVKIAEIHEHYARAIAVAEMVLDFMDGVLTQIPNMPEYPWEGWKRYFLFLFNSSPILQDVWADHKDWWSDTALFKLLERERLKITSLETEKGN